MAKIKGDFIHVILGDSKDKDLEEEELLHMILQQKVSKNINDTDGGKPTFGQKMADNIARFAGSWTFIIAFVVCLLLWILLNALMLTKAFDPYPFILLNLLLSCIAAIQAPVIMMSQNRQEEKDRKRALNDYKVNLKSEIIVEDLHKKLDEIIKNQEKLMHRMDQLEKSEQVKGK